MALRQLILLGVKAEQKNRDIEAVEASEHWTGMERPETAAKTMLPWQKWYTNLSGSTVGRAT